MGQCLYLWIKQGFLKQNLFLDIYFPLSVCRSLCECVRVWIRRVW